MPTFFGVAFFDGAGGGGMVGEVVLEPAVQAIGSFPGRTGRGERGGGGLDDQANFLYRKTQTWTALTCMLLLRYMHLRSRLGWCLSNLVVLGPVGSASFVTAVETGSAASIAVFARATTEKM